MAAGRASLWKLSGKLTKTTRTSLGYVSATFLTVSAAREQKGHWKSLISTMVTRASAVPLAGKRGPSAGFGASAAAEAFVAEAGFWLGAS